MAFITYPLNNIDYTAEDAELFHCTRTSGIWAEDSFSISVTGADNNVTVGTGIAWINNKEFSGKVTALKTAKVLDMGIADSVYSRIDVVAIQFNVNNNSTDIVVKKGTPAANPVQPAIIRTGAIYELYLASIYRTAGATVVTAGDVTDLRMDGTVCGLMADSVTQVDMTAIEAQIRAFISTLQDEINAVRDMSGLMFESEWVDGNVILLEKGGTGKSAHASNAVLTGNGTNPVNNVPTKNGAFYATEENGEPRFGILPVGQGGTGARNSTDARQALGIGSVAIENTVPISKGGTGANNAPNARSALGLGSVATENTVPIAKGGTGASTAEGARRNLGFPDPVIFSGTNQDTAPWPVWIDANFPTWHYKAIYIEAYNMVFFRLFAQPGVNFESGTTVELGSIQQEELRPVKAVPLATYASGANPVSANVQANGTIGIRFLGDKEAGASLYFSGFWFTE